MAEEKTINVKIYKKVIELHPEDEKILLISLLQKHYTEQNALKLLDKVLSSRRWQNG